MRLPITCCRLLIDSPESGAWNMAVDEALLKDAAENDVTTLRFYEWNEPTLSLGYFQKYADRLCHPASSSAAVVRRQTGGGAILHDQELTYSIALPRHHPLAADIRSLYTSVHNIIAEVLRGEPSKGETSTVIGFAEDSPRPTEPFLCFKRRSEGDIVLARGNVQDVAADHKIVGSAQRRSRGAVLQHGSILLERSPLAAELAGLNDLCDTEWTSTCLANALSHRLSQAFNFEVRERVLSDECRALAIALQDAKYGNPLWTQKS